MDSVAEEWRAIPERPGYEVSNHGRVRSLSRTVVKIRRGKQVCSKLNGRVLKPIYHRGYVVAKLGDAHKVWGVHQLVARVFHGRCPGGMVIDHVNAIKTDNRPENLEYVTNSENVRRAHENGLMHASGEGNAWCKLTDNQVDQIRVMAKDTSRSDLAKLFGVTKTHICRIINNQVRVPVS